MKIVCEKNNDVGKMLELVKHLLETEYMNYPVLEDNLVLELSLKDEIGHACLPKEDSVFLTKKDLQESDIHDHFREYCCHDALTNLYNRTKYESDIARLQTDSTHPMACIYIDAVGLHELNNRLGHSAGDCLLRSIAEGMRQHFPDSLQYRIGGDEFIILCFQPQEAELHHAIAQLRTFLRKDDYEISVGLAVVANGSLLVEAIDQSEQAMRYDKVQFYQQNGAERQIRMMNHKLEQILLEKQDTNQFLNAISSDYKGVYIVDPVEDTLRYIYIPPYFKEFVEKSNGSFSQAIQMYCDTLVFQEDKELFSSVFDFHALMIRLKQGESIGFSYRKTDGSKVYLQITIYDAEALDADKMLWIFMDMERESLHRV